jgi:hypothetical protein
MSGPDLDPRFQAGLDMLGRTGATSIDIRYQDDRAPTVYMVVVEHPVTRDGIEGRHFDAAAGMDPVTAVLRTCELVIDGGMCAHCGHPTGFDQDHASLDPLTAAMSDAVGICWYRWDPELNTFRRTCEGAP